jgi:hypothetical protein
MGNGMSGAPLAFANCYADAKSIFQKITGGNIL